MDNAQAVSSAEKSFDEYLSKRVRTGKILVVCIVIFYIILALASLVLSIALGTFDFGTLASLVISMILALALLSGVSWVKYLFAIGCFLSILPLIQRIIYMFDSRYPYFKELWFIILGIIILAICIASCILLMTNKSVDDYLYSQRCKN